MRLVTLAAFAGTLALAGCGNDPIERKHTDNVDMQVDKLFTVDGCVVYRFVDWGEPRYFASCAGAVSWQERQVTSNGKQTTETLRDASVPTAQRP